ncbi:ferritin-like domain-containing protein [Compostibacter hankyongensis]|uniref:Ferritin-like domain-containing protein n=1 Tax=Compostibacter hankyongensis TaxID=1007089 RepID=A0ABP8FZ60_9BACT
MDTQHTGSTVTPEMKELPLHRFFLLALQDMYWAENHLVESLPEMVEAATSPEVKQLINDHLEETMGQVSRLNNIFIMLDENPKEKKCKAMAGLIREASDIIDETDKGTAVRDAAIIMAAQKVEHYEIASYGSLQTFAEMMGHGEVAMLLGATLEEEKEADKKLTALAESDINEQALQQE